MSMRIAALSLLAVLSQRDAIAQVVPDPAIAPKLPSPALVGENATPLALLQVAAQALAAGRMGEAQEAMERAETRALDRSVRPSQARVPDQRPLVQQIAQARAALAGGDRGEALRLVQQAMHEPEFGTKSE